MVTYCVHADPWYATVSVVGSHVKSSQPFRSRCQASTSASFESLVRGFSSQTRAGRYYGAKDIERYSPPFPLMAKRSRDASFSPASDDSPSSIVEDEGDTLGVDAPPTKFSHTEPDTSGTLPARVMRCTLAPHRKTVCFDSQEEYDVHYTKEHTNRCAACSKNFPTPRFLELHIEENHNALREALAARGEKTYGCFVEDCDRKCSTPQKRRLHLIDKHMFPKTYNFRIVDHGIDDIPSMLREGRRRRVSTANDTHRLGRHRRQALSLLQSQPPNVGEGKTDERSASNDTGNGRRNVELHKTKGPDQASTPHASNKNPQSGLDCITQSLSALRFVPNSVRRKQNQEFIYPDSEDRKGR